MDDHELERRLRDIGTNPLDDRARRDHLARIDGASAVAGRGARRRFGPIAVAGAGVLGFLAGSTGLAMAGALPDPAQNVAHDVLGVVQVDVPEGNRGSCVSQAAKIKDKDAKQAAKDACPKGSPDDGDDDEGTGDEGNGKSEDAPGRSGNAPGKSGDAPGKSGDAPGKSGDAPGRSGDAPGKSGDAPGRSGDAPGKSGDAPGRSGDAPGRTGDVPRGNGNGVDKHADDPCRGRPVWAGPMTPDEREALKAANSRENCVDDE